jgi:hypothetical protein
VTTPARSLRARIPLAFFLAALGLHGSHAATPPTPFETELSKQSEIYGSRGANVPEGYVTGRSLLAYVLALPEPFKQSLAALGPNDRWLDVGAGEGRAIVDYVTSKYHAVVRGPERESDKAKAVAISIEDRRTTQWHETAASLPPNQIQYLVGKRLREYSAQELGHFQLITDVLGAFSYTRELTRFIEKSMSLLTVNGSLYTLLQDVHSEKGVNQPLYAGSPFLTEIKDADGSPLKVCDWLKRITCVQVTCDWSAPTERYHVRKICDDVKVPDLKLTHFAAGTPPERTFRLDDPTALAGGGQR